jgi:murein tripeptide amidase MpaA
MHYEGGLHRYVPKISSDGINWSPIDPQNVSINDTETVATIELPIDDEAVWVSAQALLLPDAYDVWMRRMVAEHDVRLEQLGESRGGQPVYVLDSDPAGRDILLLVGRQHPPEVSGADAFLAFFEALMADTPLANRFRQRFRVIAVPLMNPDGVAAGHWRHNLDGTDLNRDWGPFTQPETRLIRDLLDELDGDSAAIRVFLDFHSTDRNLLYTQDTANETDPPGFTRTWLENVAARDNGYEFTNEERGTEKEGVAKNYKYHRYGKPSSTYEVGDETDRELTRAAAAVFAEELMRLMLEQEY